MKFSVFAKSTPVIVEPTETFSNGLPVECRFINGWPCPKCGEITEHVQIDNREVCQRKSSSGRVCGEPVKGGISVDRFNGYVHSSQDWLIQRIKGIDYSETFGRDRTTGLVMFHRCCYRKLHFRELSDCGVWVDGEKVYGYTDMESQGLLKKRLL